MIRAGGWVIGQLIVNKMVVGISNDSELSLINFPKDVKIHWLNKSVFIGLLLYFTALELALTSMFPCLFIVLLWLLAITDTVTYYINRLTFAKCNSLIKKRKVKEK